MSFADNSIHCVVDGIQHVVFAGCYRIILHIALRGQAAAAYKSYWILEVLLGSIDDHLAVYVVGSEPPAEGIGFALAAAPVVAPAATVNLSG